MLLEREPRRRRIAEAKSKLRRGIDAAVGQITARFGAGARSEGGFEEFGGHFEHIVECPAALFLGNFFAGEFWQRQTSLLCQLFHGLRKGQTLREHDKIKNVAILPGRKIKPHGLLVINEKRGRLFLVERRKPAPLAAGFLELYTPSHDFRHREPGAQLVQELGGKTDGRFAMLAASYEEYREEKGSWPSARACSRYPHAARHGPPSGPYSACRDETTAAEQKAGSRSNGARRQSLTPAERQDDVPNGAKSCFNRSRRLYSSTPLYR